MQILRELWEQVRVNEKNMSVNVVLAAEEELNELITKVLQYKKSPASLKQDGILISLFYFYFWFLFLCYLFFLCWYLLDRLEVELLLSFMYMHVDTSQYMLQLRRCGDRNCCPPRHAVIASISFFFFF